MKKHTKIFKYSAVFEPAEEGGYVVTIPALPGCVTQGETFEEAKAMAKDAIKGYIAVLKEDNEPIPIESDEHIETTILVPISA
ncbi:type II toxin-antitoxin system HicB family antitoxin [Candidatus Saganbacteria bacterium]|nr:type II toxin-antitoxin system HicB family antitoxin [Candidatus Saganbacteria bacterium]